ncbi:hypothetical protein [Paraburkholderia elongata]|uniref:Uncharacterized protein n=1 Tax=Paraburkholderia elongata TaxID=2675747 RepID=A0A972SPS8_9BURK|nr:hypothetical protein [Paraburkholderia elongata]NPT59055.1 hypothetical protein [Paraburkholderia elongata]
MDFETCELEQEIVRRGLKPVGADETTIPRIFDALYVGNESLALEIMREFVQAATGRVLP